jgi:hypothetical protein
VPDFGVIDASGADAVEPVSVPELSCDPLQAIANSNGTKTVIIWSPNHMHKLHFLTVYINSHMAFILQKTGGETVTGYIKDRSRWLATAVFLSITGKNGRPAKLRGDGHWFHRVEFSPAFYTASQYCCIDAVFPELLRHTDASFIAGSTTVGDHIAARRVLVHVFNYTILQNPHRIGDSSLVVVITGPGAHVDNQRRLWFY